jgi:DNA-binding transcriptional LysR family regulator
LQLIRKPRSSCTSRMTHSILVGNRIDLAFRTGILPDSALIARKLASTHRILCASPDYLARRSVPVASADLARHHCVIAGPSTGSAHWVLDGPRGQETVAVSRRFAANEMQAVVAAAIAGYGIAQLPYHVAGGVCQGRAVAPRSRRLHDAGWRALCRVSEQPTRFAFGRRALDQPHSDLTLERRNAAADRRLGHAKQARGPRRSRWRPIARLQAR